MTTQRVVVVGASMGGMRAAEAVRRSGFGGEVLVIGAEPHPPYNRPPLSKEALATGPNAEDLAFRIPRAAQDVTWRLSTVVDAADLTARSVQLHDGSTLTFDGLIIATGLRARRLDLPGPTVGRFALRTLDDAVALHAALVPGRHLVILGAGFIACEVAATAVRRGVTVTVVAPEPRVMDRALGALLGDALQRRHAGHGVLFQLGRTPVSCTGDEHVTGVDLDDGTHLPADVVVEAAGCVPEVEWLRGNGLDLSDGVVCDDRMRVVGRDSVTACGDVARFPNSLFDTVPRRIEHWTMVTDTARRAGTSLGQYLATGTVDAAPFTPVPSFWSDQYDFRLQSFGAVGLGMPDIRLLEGDLEGEAAVGFHRDGRLVGVVMIGLGGRHLHYRNLISGP